VAGRPRRLAGALDAELIGVEGVASAAEVKRRKAKGQFGGTFQFAGTLAFGNDPVDGGATRDSQPAVDRHVADDGEVQRRTFLGPLAIDRVGGPELQDRSRSNSDGSLGNGVPRCR